MHWNYFLLFEMLAVAPLLTSARVGSGIVRVPSVNKGNMHRWLIVSLPTITACEYAVHVRTLSDHRALAGWPRACAQHLTRATTAISALSSQSPRTQPRQLRFAMLTRMRIPDADVGLLVPSAAGAGDCGLAISSGAQGLLSAGLIRSCALEKPSTGEPLSSPLHTSGAAFARSDNDPMLSPATKPWRAIL
jgi:hypothetical protein